MVLVKRAFLRACKNHSTLSYGLIDQILSPLCELHKVDKPANKEALKAFVVEIDGYIRVFDQTLVFIKHTLEDEEYLVYAKTEATPDTIANTGLVTEECQYFKKLLDKIADEGNCCIAWNQTYSDLGIEKPPKKLRMQELLKMWCQMGYFLEAEDNIYLGPRTLVELSFYLRSNHAENIESCKLCSNLVLWDIRCDSCHIQYHRDCIRKFLQKRSDCPSCNELWKTPLRASTDGRRSVTPQP
ncbi:non-structural maintenance of chromosomes element 1 homolog [Drosophila miranda]|uniref:non-structural maintenance of chromosomes element 1 homolog n=1 Tax=Drosophila miranda TaxID=7229 RepID=UPI00143F940B|nr:non-structural maintenance of chromosomes element 1 homolog [Drosophila miranda]